jgi:hypothetical protein
VVHQREPPRVAAGLPRRLDAAERPEGLTAGFLGRLAARDALIDLAGDVEAQFFVQLVLAAASQREGSQA